LKILFDVMFPEAKDCPSFFFGYLGHYFVAETYMAEFSFGTDACLAAVLLT